MVRRLPPLKTLPGFEAAARHLSFTKAAAELNVTQAAISQQIRTLEDWLGVRLFWRRNRTLLLTEEGQRYLPAVREALAGLAAATERLMEMRGPAVLTVSVIPSFAATWLLPRLRRFRALHPEIEVRIDATDALVDFGSEGVDLGIRYGRGVYPGLRSVRLFSVEMFPVCSPELLRDPRRPLRRPADLRHHTLLHDSHSDAWKLWLTAAGVTGIDAGRGPAFSHANLMLQAAIAGEGVAIGRSPLVAEALAEGRLVRPFDIALPADYAYYVVTPESAGEPAKVRAFRDWLLAEAAEPGSDSDA